MTLTGYPAQTHARSFNPHTHEGCDRVDVAYLDAALVSIHTPTKGVTGFQSHVATQCVVSIHTPTKGVTKDRCTPIILYSVSIHTPTKGVTRYRLMAISSLKVSIHTPTKGVTDAFPARHI